MGLSQTLLVHVRTAGCFKAGSEPKKRNSLLSYVQVFETNETFSSFICKSPYTDRVRKEFHAEIDHLVPSESRYSSVGTSIQFCSMYQYHLGTHPTSHCGIFDLNAESFSHPESK